VKANSSCLLISTLPADFPHTDADTQPDTETLSATRTHAGRIADINTWRTKVAAPPGHPLFHRGVKIVVASAGPTKKIQKIIYIEHKSGKVKITRTNFVCKQTATHTDADTHTHRHACTRTQRHARNGGEWKNCVQPFRRCRL